MREIISERTIEQKNGSISGKGLRIFGPATITYQEILCLVTALEVSIVFKHKCIIITIIKVKQYFLIESPTMCQNLLYVDTHHGRYSRGDPEPISRFPGLLEFPVHMAKSFSI